MLNKHASMNFVRKSNIFFNVFFQMWGVLKIKFNDIQMPALWCQLSYKWNITVQQWIGIRVINIHKSLLFLLACQAEKTKVQTPWHLSDIVYRWHTAIGQSKQPCPIKYGVSFFINFTLSRPDRNQPVTSTLCYESKCCDKILFK